ncbi:MAG: Re/Si-specific NAD(P)(+) transhydrogenase subunit alpha [Labilithrix sp.]
MRVGVPKESLEGERRVAATPESVKKLLAMGLEVVVEHGAGAASGYPDEAFVTAGASLTDDPWTTDIVIKVRPPTEAEVGKIREGATLISLLQPERNETLPALLAARKVSSIALERIPRVTRAQKMDVLSSMANLAGYRAVVEAAQHYQGFFGPQVTAAGTMPPARALIIGAGVAGLAAVAAAKALGAEVRAFDTRKATKEQVESLGAKFLTVEIEEEGEGGGGYAKEMSPAFIAAEMALFKQQASECDLIVTTALIPGKKAPTLIKKEAVDVMKRGSVIVDLAAEQGGNCELTVPNQVITTDNGVIVVGLTDLPSRMGASASRLFANNIVHLMSELVDGGKVHWDLEDDVIRPALVTHEGEVLERPSPKPVVPPPRPSARPRPPPAAEAKPAQTQIRSPTRRAWGTTAGGLVVIVLLFFAGRFAPPDLLQHSTVFILACFVGWQVIWSVTAALHTPLMSVTNAISGIIIIGGMVQITSNLNVASVLGALAALFAAINIAGGFLVTERMLRMFRR